MGGATVDRLLIQGRVLTPHAAPGPDFMLRDGVSGMSGDRHVQRLSDIVVSTYATGESTVATPKPPSTVATPKPLRRPCTFAHWRHPQPAVGRRMLRAASVDVIAYASTRSGYAIGLAAEVDVIQTPRLDGRRAGGDKRARRHAGVEDFRRTPSRPDPSTVVRGRDGRPWRELLPGPRNRGRHPDGDAAPQAPDQVRPRASDRLRQRPRRRLDRRGIPRRHRLPCSTNDRGTRTPHRAAGPRGKPSVALVDPRATGANLQINGYGKLFGAPAITASADRHASAQSERKGKPGWR